MRPSRREKVQVARRRGEGRGEPPPAPAPAAVLPLPWIWVSTRGARGRKKSDNTYQMGRQNEGEKGRGGYVFLFCCHSRGELHFAESRDDHGAYAEWLARKTIERNVVRTFDMYAQLNE